jgi:hypothetical protein
VPATFQSILQSAEREWKHWGKSTWDLPEKKTGIVHTDDEEEFAQYVIDAYCSIGGGSPSPIDIQDDRYYWSAVGMSAIMSGAGFGEREFPFSQSHSVFIRHFIAARRARERRATYWGYRFGERGGNPEPGDLVAYARGEKMTAEKAAALFDSTRPYESHSDVVVAKRAWRIDVIGCNVLDSVTKKTLRIDSQGHISDDQHFWFAVLKRREV